MAVGVRSHFAWEMKILHYWGEREGEGMQKKTFHVCAKNIFRYENAVFERINLLENEVKVFRMMKSKSFSKTLNFHGI